MASKDHLLSFGAFFLKMPATSREIVEVLSIVMEILLQSFLMLVWRNTIGGVMRVWAV
jgi:hypothetical protein